MEDDSLGGYFGEEGIARLDATANFRRRANDHIQWKIARAGEPNSAGNFRAGAAVRYDNHQVHVRIRCGMSMGVRAEKYHLRGPEAPRDLINEGLDILAGNHEHILTLDA